MVQPATLALIFKNDHQEILLVKRADVPVWVLPGGGIDENETAEDGIKREVLEETGLFVNIIRKTGQYTPINNLAKPTQVFECSIIKGNLSTGEETADIQFFPVGALPRLFFQVHKDWLFDALTHPDCTTVKLISQVTWFSLAVFFIKHPLIFLRYLYTHLKNSF